MLNSHPADFRDRLFTDATTAISFYTPYTFNFRLYRSLPSNTSQSSFQLSRYICSGSLPASKSPCLIQESPSHSGHSSIRFRATLPGKLHHVLWYLESNSALHTFEINLKRTSGHWKTQLHRLLHKIQQVLSSRSRLAVHFFECPILNIHLQWSSSTFVYLFGGSTGSSKFQHLATDSISKLNSWIKFLPVHGWLVPRLCSAKHLDLVAVSISLAFSPRSSV